MTIDIVATVPVYKSPVLEYVHVSDSDFLLGWSQPESAYFIPEGGFDIFIDGVDSGSEKRTTQQTTIISGLANGEHCFQIEARWTQVAPSLFLKSNQVCGLLEGSESAPPTASPSPKPELSLRMDPNFTRDQLPSNVRIWYDRLWAAIENPNQYTNSTEMALSNDTYDYGRGLNTHITSLLQVLRVTGDPLLLDEVDRLAQLMRAELEDWSILSKGGSTYESDGYLNWQYFHDDGYHGTDVHKMDEALAHSLTAAFAYAFYVNRDLDARYAERAAFWTDYLKNHFEAKWRDRENIPNGFPFYEKRLAHVYLQWTRYHYYMHKLTGEQDYYDEAVRMTSIMNQHITQTSTPIGVAAQWTHGMPVLGADSLGAQPMNYARYTVHAAADLASEGFSVYGQTGFMDEMARMLSYFIMDSTSPNSFNGRNDGSDPGGESASRYSISPYTQLGRWDDSGRVLDISEQTYLDKESNKENPTRVYIPAGMVFSLLR